MDSLSPESRALYEILMADTAEIYESKFAAYRKDRLDAVKQFADNTRMRIKELQTTVDSVPGKVEIEVDSVKAALGEDLAVVKSALNSENSVFAPDLAGFKLDTTVDNLSPGARRCYDYLTGATDIFHEPDAVTSSPTTTRPASTASLHAPSSSAKDCLTTEARRISGYLVGGTAATTSVVPEVSSMLQASTALNSRPIAVDIKATEFTSAEPTSCSSKCPSNDAFASMAVISSSAIPSSPTTTGGVVHELPAPEVNITVLAATTSMTTGGSVSKHCCSEPETAATTRTANYHTSGAIFTTSSAATHVCEATLTPLSPVASSAPTAASPTTVSAVSDLLKGEDNLNLYPPWPPPWSITSQADNMCKDMPQALLLNSLSIGSTQLMLWAVKIPWPPDFSNGSTCVQNIPQLDCQDMSVLPRISSLPLRVESVEHMSRVGIQLSCLCSQDAELFVSCFAAWPISNLHGAKEIMHYAQLQPVLFKWSDLLCFDIRFLRVSTFDFLLARRSTHIAWNLSCLDDLHYSLGSTNWALEVNERQVLLPMPWPSFRYHLVFSIGETGDFLHYEHVQQWRPADQVISLACVSVLFLRFLDCWSDIHWAQSTIASFDDLLQHDPRTTEFLEVCNVLCRLTDNQFLADLFVIEHWLVPWEPGVDSPGHNLIESFIPLAIACELLYLRLKPPWSLFAQASSASEFMSNIRTVSESLHNSSISFELHLLSDFSCTKYAITCQLDWSMSIAATSLAACYWQGCMRCVHLIAWFLVMLPLFLIGLCLNMPTSNVVLGCHSPTLIVVEMRPASMKPDQLAITTLTAVVYMFAPAATLHLHFLSGKVIILSKAAGNSALVQYCQGPQDTDESDCVPSSHAYVLHWASQLVAWENAISTDGILIYAKQVLLSWDPGGSDPIDAATGINWNSIQLPCLHLTWDPGGFRRHRLEGKPNFKEGGLSATCPLLPSWAGECGVTLGPGLLEDTSRHYIYRGDGQKQLGLERNGLDGGFGRGLAWRALRVRVS